LIQTNRYITAFHYSMHISHTFAEAELMKTVLHN